MCSHAKGEAALLEVEKAIGKERFQDMDKSDRIHRDLFGVHLHSQVRVEAELFRAGTFPPYTMRLPVS